MTPPVKQPPFVAFLAKIWEILFVVIYPVIMVFSLVFTGILLIFSALSRLLFWLLGGFKTAQKPRKSNSASSVH